MKQTYTITMRRRQHPTPARTTLERTRQAHQRYQDLHNEGGEGFNPHAEALRQAQAAHDATVAQTVQAQLDADNAAWTREVTTARRAAWNAWVQAQGGCLTAAQVQAQCQAQGFALETLRHHIARHGL